MAYVNTSYGFNSHLEMGKFGTLKIKFFSMCENKKVKGQRQKKCRVDPQLELKSTATKKIDLTIEETADNMKLSMWRVVQGIMDEQQLVLVLSMVVAKDLSLEEMIIEFNKVSLIKYLNEIVIFLYKVLISMSDFTIYVI